MGKTAVLTKNGFLLATAFIFGFVLGLLIPSEYREFADNSGLDQDRERICLENHGLWLATHRECEGPTLKQDFCDKNKGEFFDCQSPCRHDPDETICQEVCINVCRF